MKQYNLNISGSGTAKDIASALRTIANAIEQGNHINAIEEKGEASWEDSTLFTTIDEVEDNEKAYIDSDDCEKDTHVYDSQGEELQRWDKVKTSIPVQDEHTEYSFLGEGTVVWILGENLIHVVSNDETRYDYTLKADKLTKLTT